MNIYDDQQIKDIIDKCEDILKDYPVEHNQYDKIKIQIAELERKLKNGKQGKSRNE
jgi:hypothetical protein